MNEDLVTAGLLAAVIVAVVGLALSRARDIASWACLVGFGILLAARVL